MSYSSIYIIDQDTHLSNIIKYSNSWLFAPVVCEIILNSYIQDELRTSYGIAKSLFTSDGDHLFRMANKAVNNSSIMSDRVAWEVSNQQIMSVKDKEFIADSLLKFVDDHKNDVMLYNKKNNLEYDHIANRFKKIAEDIRNIDSDKKYFIFKNTSVDDSIEYFFTQHDEELDDFVPLTLEEASKEYEMELVIFSDDYSKMDFISSNNPEFKL